MRLTKDETHASSEFNNLFYILSLLYDKEGILLDYRKIILEKITHRPVDQILSLNFNFRALRLLNILLSDQIFKKNTPEEEIMQEVDWIFKLQDSEGFFTDSQINRGDTCSGVPHLAYHAKITMCVGLIAFFTKRKDFLSTFEKAMRAHLSIIPSQSLLFYGRSTNSTFGIACFYLNLVLMEVLLFKNTTNIQHSVEDLLIQLQKKDGLLYINTSRSLNRHGYDSYMYDVVYSSYACALLLLSEKIRLPNSPRFLEPLPNPKDFVIFEDSGFVTFKINSVKSCINFKGHQNSYKHLFDSRLSPFSILYAEDEAKNRLPAVGFPPQKISPLVKGIYLYPLLKSICYKFKYYRYLPVLSGNTFYIELAGGRYYPFKPLTSFFENNSIYLDYELRSRNLKSILAIKIQLSFQNCYKQEINFPFRVDTLTYTLRCASNRLERIDKKAARIRSGLYSFNHVIHKVNYVPIETSSGLGYLHILTFKNIKSLTVSAKWH